jgi:hypothetical protein
MEEAFGVAPKPCPSQRAKQVDAMVRNFNKISALLGDEPPCDELDKVAIYYYYFLFIFLFADKLGVFDDD